MLPDGYCRRTRSGRARIAREVLGRPEVAAQLLADAEAEEAAAAAAGAGGAAAKKKAGVPPADETPRKEAVTLLNGDRFDGHWLFGRKHGRGVYHFTSGSKYEGTWDCDKMVGVGFFTDPDGKRNVIRHPPATKK